MFKNIFKTITAAALLSASFGGNAKALPITENFDITASNFTIDAPNFPPANAPTFNANFSLTFDPTQYNWWSPVNTTNKISVEYNNAPLSYSYNPSTHEMFIASDGGAILFDQGNVWIALSISNTGTSASLLDVSYWLYGNQSQFYSSTGSVQVSSVSAVPLPPSFGLFVAALGGLVLLAYKRKQTAI